MQFNSLSGPTTHNIGWNPVYNQLLASDPHQVGQHRRCIAYHGAGHAIIQHQAGVKKLALRMPSFSDTPHVEVVVPMTTVLPCGQQKNDIAKAITELCYYLVGYVAESLLNDGELRDIAAMDDFELAIDITNQLGADLDEEAARIMIAAYLVVETELAKAYEVQEELVKLLLGVGFVSFDEFTKITKPLKPCNFAAKVLAMLHSPVLGNEMERIERRLA